MGAALPSRVQEIIQQVAELPNRTSPDDWPEAMLVTADELQCILETALRDLASALQQTQAENLELKQRIQNGERVLGSLLEHKGKAACSWCSWSVDYRIDTEQQAAHEAMLNHAANCEHNPALQLKAQLAEAEAAHQRLRALVVRLFRFTSAGVSEHGDPADEAACNELAAALASPESAA